MLAYRVIPYLPDARAGEPGHPQYLHPAQGKGRLDNVDHYRCWYLAGEQTGAVAEVFADLTNWTEAMFAYPALPDARRALACYELPDDLPLLELDDARNLLDRGLRPTQVIERNRAATQAWALRIFEERPADGSPRWSGVRWWSYHRSQWRILGIWGAIPNCVAVDPLHLRHPAVVDAAHALAKKLP